MAGWDFAAEQDEEDLVPGCWVLGCSCLRFSWVGAPTRAAERARSLGIRFQIVGLPWAQDRTSHCWFRVRRLRDHTGGGMVILREGAGDRVELVTLARCMTGMIRLVSMMFEADS